VRKKCVEKETEKRKERAEKEGTEWKRKTMTVKKQAQKEAKKKAPDFALVHVPLCGVGS
jgi:hypothetical protein